MECYVGIFERGILAGLFAGDEFGVVRMLVRQGGGQTDVDDYPQNQSLRRCCLSPAGRQLGTSLLPGVPTRCIGRRISRRPTNPKSAAPAIESRKPPQRLRPRRRFSADVSLPLVRDFLVKMRDSHEWLEQQGRSKS